MLARFLVVCLILVSCSEREDQQKHQDLPIDVVINETPVLLGEGQAVQLDEVGAMALVDKVFVLEQSGSQGCSGLVRPRPGSAKFIAPVTRQRLIYSLATPISFAKPKARLCIVFANPIKDSPTLLAREK